MKKPATRLDRPATEYAVDQQFVDDVLAAPDPDDPLASGVVTEQDLGIAQPVAPMPIAATITPVPDHKRPDIYPFPPHNLTRYESRIRIVEAWQYQGTLVDAPPFVEKTWAAWGDPDQARNLPAGPALRVPMVEGRETEKLCRKGDYVVRQEVTLALGVDPDMRIEVWPREEFEKFFLPTSAPATLGQTFPAPADTIEKGFSADASA